MDILITCGLIFICCFFFCFFCNILLLVSLDGKWFSMYEVISFEAKNDLAFLSQELKEKDMVSLACE